MKKIYNASRYILSLLVGAGLVTQVSAQGDLCDFALPVTPGVHLADGPATGFGASNVCYAAIATNSDWYSYTPANDGVIEVFSCVGTIDTRLSIHDGSCLGLNCVAFDDDGCLGSFASQVIGMPVTGGTTYYIEWDDYWTTIGFSWELLLHDCSAPEATFTRVNDCPNFQYSIDVDITDMGSALTVDITNDGGAPPILGATLGSYTVGPFFSGSVVSVNLVHDADPFCDLGYGPVTNIPCPLVSCGPDNYSYCYGDNDTTMFLFQAASTDPLAIQFNAGGISTFGDIVNIYDGDDQTAPLLFSGDNGGDLTGLVVVSTNPDGYLLLQSVSSAFTSCQSGGVSPPWDWDVACLDCTQPTVDFEVVDDCIHKEFFIEVDITDMGDANTVDITNDIGIAPILGVGLGTYQVGPVEMDQMLEVTVVHDVNPLCSIKSGDMVHYFDSCAIACGNDVYTYCYTNNDTAWFLYQSAGGLPITMHFYDGKMAPDDQLVIYNGKNTLSGVLFNTLNGADMTGTTVVGQNNDGALLMRLYSDAVNSCDDGGTGPELEWYVGCGAVGIEESSNASDQITIYPNPTNGIVSIAYSVPVFQQVSINVFDDLGRVVRNKEVAIGPGTIIEMDLNNVDNGVYFVEVISENGRAFERLVIQH